MWLNKKKFWVCLSMCCVDWFVPGRRVTVPPAATLPSANPAISATNYANDNGMLLFVCCTSDCVCDHTEITQE